MAAAALPSGLELSLLVTLAASLALAAMLVLRAAGGIFGPGSSGSIASASISPLASAVSAVRRYSSQLAASIRGSLTSSLTKAGARVRSGKAQQIDAAAHAAQQAAAVSLAPSSIGAVQVPSRSVALTREAQWARLDAIATRSVDAARIAHRAHTSAADKLDAADYQLGRLLAEIAPVMRARPRPASIAAFPAPKSRAAGGRATDAQRVAA